MRSDFDACRPSIPLFLFPSIYSGNQHPDRFKTEATKKDAEESFKKLITAYRVLKDPEQREEYHRGQLRN